MTADLLWPLVALWAVAACWHLGYLTNERLRERARARVDDAIDAELTVIRGELDIAKSDAHEALARVKRAGLGEALTRR